MRREATEPQRRPARQGPPSSPVNSSSYTKGPGEPGAKVQRSSGLSGCLGEHVAQMNEKYLSVSLCSPSPLPPHSPGSQSGSSHLAASCLSGS